MRVAVLEVVRIVDDISKQIAIEVGSLAGIRRNRAGHCIGSDVITARHACKHGQREPVLCAANARVGLSSEQHVAVGGFEFTVGLLATGEHDVDACAQASGRRSKIRILTKHDQVRFGPFRVSMLRLRNGCAQRDEPCLL